MKNKKEINAGIYVIEIEGCEKFYIGSTINFKRRKWEHLNKLRKNKHYNPYMQNVFNKYGEDALKFKLFIYTDPDKEYLFKLEQKVIDSYDWNELINCAKITGKPGNKLPENRKFSISNIIEIFKLAASGKSLNELCKLYGYDKTNIHNIISRKTYLDVEIDNDIILLAQKNISLNKNIKFSQDEIEFIKDNYSKINRHELAKRIGRNANSISNLARKLGLTDNTTFWTKDIDDFIIKNYQNLGRSKCAKIIGVSVKTLTSRINRLKRKGIDIRINKVINTTATVWTDDKIKFLKNNIEKGSKFLANYFNTNASNIRDICHNNNIKLGTKIWKQEDIDFLMENYIEFGSKYCAKKLNKTIDSVVQKYNYEKKKNNSLTVNYA